MSEQNNAQNNIVQLHQQPTTGATFRITAEIDGFPVTIEVTGKAEALRGMIDRLKVLGATPPAKPAPAAAATGTPEPATKAEQAPKCPSHRSVMKKGRKEWFCPRKDGDDFCDETKAL